MIKRLGDRDIAPMIKRLGDRDIAPMIKLLGDRDIAPMIKRLGDRGDIAPMTVDLIERLSPNDQEALQQLQQLQLFTTPSGTPR